MKTKWKQSEKRFSKSQLNDLVLVKLEKINQLQGNVKLVTLEYTTKREKSYNFSMNTHYLFLFKRYTLEDADKERNDLLSKLSGMNRGEIPVERRSF